MDIKYPTNKLTPQGAPCTWEISTSKWNCCGNNASSVHTIDNIICTIDNIIPKGSIIIHGNAGWIECMACAIANGHGQPPAELLDSVIPPVEKPKMIESIKSKNQTYSASYWKVAEKDLTCQYGCLSVIPKGTIYIARLNFKPSCVGCLTKAYSHDKMADGPLWVPTLADFGVTEMLNTVFTLGGPTLREGWIWVSGANLAQMHYRCWPPVGGCDKFIQPEWICAQNIGITALVLCPTCAAKAGHGSFDGVVGLSLAQPKKRTKKAPMICIKCNIPLCEACGECETKGCRLVGRAVCTPDQLAKVKHLLAETQKVRGYVALSEVLKTPRPFKIITDAEDVAMLSGVAAKSFVRPCPVRPRHGFVESRLVDANVVNNVNDVVDAIFTEARSADPQAELLIVPYVDSALNMVITPTRLAIGAGNDGATAGKGSITIPLMGEKFSEIEPKLLAQAGVDTREDDPYFEAVVDKSNNIFFTQLRAGVKIPSAVGDDYIPKDMIAEEVIDASGDLLEWESQVKRIKPGTVVCHVGGTLTSHYGVHCLYNNIPVMTSRRPEVGEFLHTKSKGAAPDPEAVRRGLSVGITIPFKQDVRAKDGITCKHAIQTLLVALHNAGAMGEKDGFWIGFAAAAMMRVGMAASHGEARHKNIPKTGKVNRGAVYTASLADFFGSRETLGAAQWSFQNLSWNSGYGGPKWAKCTEAIIDLDAVIVKFLNDPTDSAVSKLITVLNNAVNQAHNGGWWLNKFVDVNEFDRAAAQSINLIASAGIGMFKIANAKFADLDGYIERWRAAAPIVVAKGTILAYTKVDENKDYGMPTCVKCGTEYPYFKKYFSAIAEGMSCGGCFDGVVEFKLNGEFIEVETPEVAEDIDSSLCGNTSCPECYPENNVDDTNEDDDPPSPPEINQHTNVNSLIKILPEHTVLAAQGKLIKSKLGPSTHFHFQVKTDASAGYYSFDVAIPSLNAENLELYAHEWSWAGSESHEYVALSIIKSTNGVGEWNFFNSLAGINFNFDILTGKFKDNYNEPTQAQIGQGQSSQIQAEDESPF